MLKPPPILKVSDWADRFRKLSSESSAEPGQWVTDRAPFQRGIMDAINDPKVKEIWCMKSAQIGWTEILGNAIGFFMHQDPAPMLLVQPTGAMAQAWSKDRLNPMLRDTPVLRGKVKDERTRKSERNERGNTIAHKRFPGGSLSIIGANSPSSLASRPIRVVLFDEVDRYPKNVGRVEQREGNVVSLAKKRTTTFWNRKIFGGSTPTIKGFSEIEHRYENSDQRRYYVPCPECREHQILVWSNVKWDRDADGNHLPHTARYLCVHCGSLIEEHKKQWMLRHGEWRATKPFTGIAGFHIWEAYSPWVTWAQLVASFLASKDDPTDFQTFVNTSLGETWQDKGAEVSAKGLPERREPYDYDHLPDGILLLTVGVDVQDNRIEIGLDGWGKNEENWKLPNKVILGDPSQDQIWSELDQFLTRKFVTESGYALMIEAVCVDSGGHHTQKVYNYCMKRKQYRVFAVKGNAGTGALAWPKEPTKIKATGGELFVIGVDTIKDVLFSRLQNVTEPGKGGYTHFSTGCDDGYFRQLTSEVVVSKYIQGRKIRYWQPKNTKIRQEALDCWVYSYAAKEARAADLNYRAQMRAEQKEIAQQVIMGGQQPNYRTRRVRSAGVQL